MIFDSGFFLRVFHVREMPTTMSHVSWHLRPLTICVYGCMSLTIPRSGYLERGRRMYPNCYRKCTYVRYEFLCVFVFIVRAQVYVPFQNRGVCFQNTCHLDLNTTYDVINDVYQPKYIVKTVPVTLII